MFIDFNYYKNTYGGTLTEAEFNKQAPKACNYITQQTMTRITDTSLNTYPSQIIDQVKRCACNLTDDYSAIERARKEALISGGQLRSEKAGEVSVSYESKTILSEPAVADEYLLTTLRQYLGLIEVNGKIYNLLSKVLRDRNCCCGIIV